jgi:protein-S-isoprenylcysteine O-methyltransferase Ste14
MNRWIPPPVAFAIAAVAMWAIARALGWGRFAFEHQAALGIALIVLGIAIVAVALRSFAAARTTPNPIAPHTASRLVTSGIYRRTRNPMYVADVVMLLGIAVWLGSVPALLPVAAFVAFIDRVQIAAEERALAELFGEPYAAYRREVRRWL